MKYGYRDKFEKHETPVSDWSARSHRPQSNLWSPHRVPENMFAAIMETLPHENPGMTEDERDSDWQLFQQKLDSAGLTVREQIVLDSMVFGGMSLTQTAAHLARCEGRNKTVSKTEVARIRDRAYSKLRLVFQRKDAK